MILKKHFGALGWALSVVVTLGCSMPKEIVEASKDNVDVLTDQMFKRTEGRIKPEHLEACREKYRPKWGSIKLRGEPSYARSRFYTCMLTNNWINALKGDDYVVYVGKQPVVSEGIPGVQPGDHGFHVSMICAYRVSAEAVTLDNSLIPKQVASSSMCKYARDMPLTFPQKRLRVITVPVRR